jgi:glutamate formiminotransferase
VTGRDLLECVVNVSEGRDSDVISSLARAAGSSLLDVHSDAFHHRTVLTLAATAADLPQAVRSVAAETLATVDLEGHDGVHPRIGALDVVPWVALSGWPVGDGDLREAVSARDDFAAWAGSNLRLPCFLYGPERSLPEVRRRAWRDLRPDTGPDSPHPRAGAAAVGARPLLVAYNVWLAEKDLGLARATASRLRAPEVRALGLRVGERVQVSMNLISPWRFGPGAAYDAVASHAAVDRAELVGLIPEEVLRREPTHRYQELGLDPRSTIEARLEQAGLDGGRFGGHRG